MKDYLLDANVLIRFLVADDARQSAAATSLFEKAERREVMLHLDALVVAETVYVLMGRYGRSRSEVADVLLSLIQNAGIQTQDSEVVWDALQKFAGSPVDFADAWLAARAVKLRCPVASFDRDFDKFKDIRRHEPGT